MSREGQPFSCGAVLWGGGPATDCWLLEWLPAKSLWSTSFLQEQSRSVRRVSSGADTNGFCSVNYLMFDCFCLTCICYFHIKAECSLDCLFLVFGFFFFPWQDSWLALLLKTLVSLITYWHVKGGIHKYVHEEVKMMNEMLGDWSSKGTDFASCIQVLCRVPRNVLQDSRTIYADMEMIKTAF